MQPLVRFIGAGILAVLVAAHAQAQPQADAFPNRPVKLIVPFPPGGPTDLMARVFGQKLSERWGQPVVIENRAGGNSAIGAQQTAKSLPDGYTLLVAMDTTLVMNPITTKNLPYDALKDFAPISLTAQNTSLLIVPADGPQSVQELIAKAKANPGKLTNASSANGSPGHVGGELFKYMTGTQIQHVPYRGGSAATTDLIAGHVDLMFESLNSIAPMSKSGEVRALGVSGDKRSSAFPDVPTIAEAGVPGYSAPTWTGLIGPAGLPPAILEKLNGAVNRAIRSPGFLERFSKIGDEPAGGTPKDFADVIAKDTAKWKDVVARSGAKLD